MGRILAPLAGWNVRGYSYGELQPNGEHHPGADLNVGFGDEDSGMPVVCFADGTVVERKEWDGRTYGFGNVGLVEHRLFGDEGSEEGVRLWSLYAHLDGFADSFIEGRQIEAGEQIGTCGKSGGQTWAHVHFELRYKGPPEMTSGYWGGRLNYEAQSERYADPYTVLRVLEGANGGRADDVVRPEAADGGVAAARRAEIEGLRADRDFNFRLKMEMEHYLRTEALYRRQGRRYVRVAGAADELIARVTQG